MTNGEPLIAGMTPEQLRSHPKLQKHRMESEAAAQAVATPLPGALKHAFAVTPEITVGPYKVRPFVDRDYEFLQQLGHPLHLHVFTDNKQNPVEMIQGACGRQLCWMFTRPFKEVKAAFLEKGVDGVKTLADDTFEESNLDSMLALGQAIFQQLGIYWESVVAFQPIEADEGTEKKT